MEIMNKIPVKSEATASRILGEEAVVVLPRESIINTLNSVGSRIWELSDGSNNVSDIINIIQNEFDVEPEEAERDTVDFINELAAKKMLVLNEISDDCS